MPESLHLRRATSADAPLLRRWDREPHLLAAKGDDDWEWESELGRELDWREHLVAEVDGTPIGFLQIIDPAREETRYWGNVPSGLRAIDIWIGESACLGKGYGTRLMREAIGRCFADPSVRAILIDPLAGNVRAQRFYQRLGFRPVARQRFGADECLVHRLERRDWLESSRDR